MQGTRGNDFICCLLVISSTVNIRSFEITCTIVEGSSWMMGNVESLDAESGVVTFGGGADETLADDSTVIDVDSTTDGVDMGFVVGSVGSPSSQFDGSKIYTKATIFSSLMSYLPHGHNPFALKPFSATSKWTDRG